MTNIAPPFDAIMFSAPFFALKMRSPRPNERTYSYFNRLLIRIAGALVVTVLPFSILRIYNVIRGYVDGGAAVILAIAWGTIGILIGRFADNERRFESLFKR